MTRIQRIVMIMLASVTVMLFAAVGILGAALSNVLDDALKQRQEISGLMDASAELQDSDAELKRSDAELKISAEQIQTAFIGMRDEYEDLGIRYARLSNAYAALYGKCHQ